MEMFTFTEAEKTANFLGLVVIITFWFCVMCTAWCKLVKRHDEKHTQLIVVNELMAG